MLQNSYTVSAKLGKVAWEILERTNRMGPTTKTRIATSTTSRIMRYITLSTPKVNHQRCGDDCRQVLVELYTNIWASTNQTSVKVDPRSDNLSVRRRIGVMCDAHA